MAGGLCIARLLTCFETIHAVVWSVRPSGNSVTIASMTTVDARRSQLETLWRTDRGDFLAEYRRVVGGPPDGPGMSPASMIDRIIERESSEGRLGR
jgi:hypothetical protein